jgi:hypothetical protein
MKSPREEALGTYVEKSIQIGWFSPGFKLEVKNYVRIFQDSRKVGKCHTRTYRCFVEQVMM